MANKLIRGITIEIGGDTTKLGKAIEDSEKKSRSLQSELREIDNALKFDPSNVELLAQRQTVLTQNVEETSKKLEVLREAERQVIEQFRRGEVAEEQVRALQREIIKTDSALSNMSSELNGVEGNLDDVGDSARDSTEGFTVMKGALADLVANAIQGAIGAIGDFIGSLFELSEATEEYRVMQSKLEGSAKSFGYSMDFVKGKYEEFYKYLGDDQMSTNAITNLLGLGTSTENLSKLAEGAIGVWTAYGDSIPIESLTESINETAQVGKITGTLADALNWAGISEDDFNAKLEKTNSTQERADMIAQVLNDTYGESKDTYDELSKSITDANEAELALKDTQAELGEVMAPVNTAITDLKNKALEALLPVITKVVDELTKFTAWLKENPVALGIIVGLVTALTTAFTIFAGALAIQGIINGVTMAMSFLGVAINGAMLPVTLIVGAIAGLVAGFIYLWNNCEGFRNFWINLWEIIKSAVSVAVEAVISFMSGAWTTITEVWGVASEWFSGIIGAIVGFFSDAKDKVVEIWTSITSWFAEIWNGIVAVFSPAIEWFSSLFGSIYDTLASIIAVIVELIRGTWTIITTVFGIAYEWFNNTVLQPIRDAFTVVWDKIKNLATVAWLGIKAVWNAVSGWFNKTIITPISNFFSKMWTNLKTGASLAWIGIKNVFSNVTGWFRDKFSQAWNAVKTVFSIGGKVFSGITEGITSMFKKVVNVIIGGLNKVIAKPFNTINSALGTIRNISIAGISPFGGLPSISVPQIPLLYRGGILKRGQVGLLEGNGSEAVVPLEKETGWINRIAQKMNDLRDNIPTSGDIALMAKMDELIRTMKSHNSTIVLDTGVLVGETINQIDEGLGNNYSLRERRI